MANDIYFARFWHENLIIVTNKIFNPRIQRLGGNYVALKIYLFKRYISFSRVSMGLTDRRKTAKNLVDSRKN